MVRFEKLDDGTYIDASEPSANVGDYVNPPGNLPVFKVSTIEDGNCYGVSVERPFTYVIARRDLCEVVAKPLADHYHPPVARETILDEASRLTREDRGETYAHPSVNFERIAALWSTYLGVEVTPEQTAVCQMLVKISRLMASPGHRDSLVDLAGYARTIEMLGEVTP